jgi:sugar phosphate isomerase/epimerase
MNMLGISISSWRNFTLINAVKNAVNLDFRAVEFGPVHTYTNHDVEKIKILLGSKKVFIHAPIFKTDKRIVINIAAENKTTREITLQTIKNAIQVARRFDCHLISFHGGYNIRTHLVEKSPGIYKPEHCSERISENKVIKNSADFVKKLLKIYKKTMFAIENLNSTHGNLFNDAKNFKKFFNEISDKRVGILLDTGHLNFYCRGLRDDQIKFVETFKNKIFEVHLNDNDGRDDLHLAPGMGNAPIEDIFEILDANQLPIVLELLNPSDNDVKNAQNFVKSKLHLNL